MRGKFPTTGGNTRFVTSCKKTLCIKKLTKTIKIEYSGLIIKNEPIFKIVETNVGSAKLIQNKLEFLCKLIHTNINVLLFFIFIYLLNKF